MAAEQRRLGRRTLAWAAAAVLAGLALAAGWIVHSWRASSAQSEASGSQAAETGEPAPPRLICDELEYDVGIVDPADPIGHAFTVRNAGGSPLLLVRGGTSCDCTMSELPDEQIPPNGEALVRVGMKTVEKPGEFTQWAKVLSNDPDRQAVVFKIRGTVQTYLAADPPEVVLTNLRRTDVRRGRYFVYSQIWKQFQLTHSSASNPELKCEIEPGIDSDLRVRDAVAGYWCKVSLPPMTKGREMAEWVELSAVGEKPGEKRSLRLSLKGNVVYWLTLSGDRLEVGDVLRIGALGAGEGFKDRLTLKIRDEKPELVIRRIETKPAFLRVRVEPFTPDSARIGLYRVEVEIPPDAPPCVYQATEMGEIRIAITKPKEAELRLKVAFAVASSH